MNQEVKFINIKDLVLWTENPRDPFDEKLTDQEIANKAFSDRSKRWSLVKLAKEMGAYYDFSELPTVVFHNNIPVVYDGNRRIILGKIKHGLISVSGGKDVVIPDFPETIPCNVCSKEVALTNILRKHGDSGSWLPLERDYFLHKHLKHPKSAFLILEEKTNIITTNPHMNQGFVKKEIFKDESLKKLGIKIKDDNLETVHSDQEFQHILEDISNKVKNEIITTRKNRGNILSVLEPKNQEIIDQNKNKDFHEPSVDFRLSPEPEVKVQRQTRRTPKSENEIFGGKLYLRYGDVSDLYRDITDLYLFYNDHKDTLSKSFPSLIRMSMRILVETAAENTKIDNYLQNNFDEAKKYLSTDMKTTLSNQNVRKETIVQLLHTGAHNYKAASNLEQTVAISVILGEMLKLTHGQ